MKLLLDTHAFLWLVEGNAKLTEGAQAALADPQNELFLSVASVWELAIKVGNGKLVLSEPLEEFVPKWTNAYQLTVLSVESSHALAVTKLPLHHRDPFDRLLVGQAHIEGMSLVSGDAKLAQYGQPIVW